jgi:hypothetical protein
LKQRRKYRIYKMKPKTNKVKSEWAKAAGRFLKLMEKSKPVKTLDDKKLRKEHLLKKYG